MTPRRRNGLILSGAAALLVVGVVGYWAGRQSGPATAPLVSASKASPKVLYWYDPMTPDQHSPTPGKSPMGMEMIPRYAAEADAEPAAGPNPGPASAPGVRIDPAAVQNLGLRIVEARSGVLADDLVTTGIVQFNERDLAIVQPRASGFVQRVYGRAPGDVIAAGAPIVDLLIPDWGGAQAEFLAVMKAGDPLLAAAARQRLLLLGMSPGLIGAVEHGGRVRSTITVGAPTSGVIQKLDVRQGMTVTAGQSLAEINGLKTVWVIAAVPEAQAARVRTGQPAKVSFDAYPGENFAGRVQAVLPQVAGDSRTLQARIALPNPGGRLRPGLFAKVAFGGGGADALLVPSEALIRTGRRTLIMLARPNGRFEPVEVQAGRESGDQTEILAGVSAGDRVVASGQFLLDSEASLSGLDARPLPSAPPPSAPAGSPLARTQGRIESVAPGAITISHQPVASIGWPAMTMTFRVVDPGLTRRLKAGDQVSFGFDQPPAGPTLRTIIKSDGAR